MIELLPTNDIFVIKTLMTIPGLPEASFTDDDLRKVKEGTWEPALHWEYLIAMRGTQALGIIALQPLTDVLVEWHWYLNPIHWGKAVSDEICPLLMKHLEKTTYHSLLAEVPEACKPVMEAGRRAGLTLVGLLPKSVRWRGNIIGLYILHKTLKES